MTNLTKLSLERLQQRLAELSEEWNQVEAAVEQRVREDKQLLAKQVRQKIVDAGYDLEDIIGLLQNRRRSTRSSTDSYATWIDPDNTANIYRRGPLPAWLKDKMAAAGVDPTNKEQRETFKRDHLTKA